MNIINNNNGCSSMEDVKNKPKLKPTIYLKYRSYNGLNKKKKLIQIIKYISL